MTKTIRLIEMFAGYGSQALALEYLGLPFEHHFVCEIDKYAIKSYNEIHGTNFDTLDIKDVSAKDLNIVDKDKYDYLFTYSFPCTSLSLAGKREGMQRDSGTASSLLWEVERIIDDCGDNLPQYLMMENVPQVIGNNNKKFFMEWVQFLESKGYRNYYQIMNATDYGVPQHRERVIMVSILNSENKNYEFPKKQPLTTLFEDILDTNPIDEKYYLSSQKIERIKNWKSYQNPLSNILDPSNPSTVTSTLTARGAGEEHAGMQLLFDNHEIVDHDSSKAFWSSHEKEVVSPTLKTKNHLGVVETNWRPAEKSLITEDGNVKKYNYSSEIEEFGVGQTAVLSYPGGYGHGGGRVSDVSPTLTAVASSSIATKEKNLAIRKLTPRECFRLMGVKDEDYEKLTCSDQQKYKQAGNSIVVNVLMAVFTNLFIKECKKRSLF